MRGGREDLNTDQCSTYVFFTIPWVRQPNQGSIPWPVYEEKELSSELKKVVCLSTTPYWVFLVCCR